MSTRTVQARWLFPGDRPPIEHGLMTVADGRIVAVEASDGRRADLDFGDAAVLPGLVNAHTHLDLGALRGKFPPPASFCDWLRAVVAYRRNSAVAEWQAAISAGIDQSIRSGTTLIGDISVGGHSAALLAASPLKSVVFYELIGLSPKRADEAWREAMSWLGGQPLKSSGHVGLSPHAPYSVRSSLLALAASIKLPLAVHFAETREEIELLQTHGGPLREFLEEAGAWSDAGGLGLDHLKLIQLIRLAPDALFIHGNYLDRSHYSEMKAANVIFCPRTHAYFGHSPHPFREMLASEINVALGTDSLASNPDLSILEEMRFLRRQHPNVSAETVLQMGTIRGAQALGWDLWTGTLSPNKMADWIVLDLEGWQDTDPYRLWLESSKPVREVWISGERV